MRIVRIVLCGIALVAIGFAAGYGFATRTCRLEKARAAAIGDFGRTSPSEARAKDGETLRGTLDQIRLQMSFDEVVHHLPKAEDEKGWVRLAAPAHHYTIPTGTGERMVLNVQASRHLFFLMVFDNRRLTKIVSLEDGFAEFPGVTMPPDLEDVPRFDAEIQRNAGVPAEKLATAVAEKIRQREPSLRRELAAIERGAYPKEPPPFEARQRELLAKYDGTKVRLKDSTDRLFDLYGEPSGLRLNGSDAIYEFGGLLVFRGYSSKVLVELKDGEVARVRTVYIDGTTGKASAF
jgi:hypothetical protein